MHLSRMPTAGQDEVPTLHLVVPNSCHTPLHHAHLHPHTMRALLVHCDDLISLHPHPSHPPPPTPLAPPPLYLLHAWPDSSLPLLHVSLHPSTAHTYGLSTPLRLTLHHHPSPHPPFPVTTLHLHPTSHLPSSPSLSSISRQLLGRLLLPHSFTLVSLLQQPTLLLISHLTSPSSPSSSIPAVVTPSTSITLLSPPLSSPSPSSQAALTFPHEWAALTTFLVSPLPSPSPSPSPSSPSSLLSLSSPSSLLLYGPASSGRTFLLSSLPSPCIHLHIDTLLSSPACSPPPSPAPAPLTSALRAALALPSPLLILHHIDPLLFPSPSPFSSLTSHLAHLLSSSTLRIIASSSSPPPPSHPLHFDTELAIRTLSNQARRAILTWHSVPANTASRVADSTHGLTAGQLVRVVRHAQLLAAEAEEEYPGVDPGFTPWRAAISHVCPSSSDNLLASGASAAGVRGEGALPVPLSLSSSPAELFPLVGGYAEMKKRLALVLHTFLRPSPSALPVGGVLLQGGRGTGKSLLASSMAALAPALGFSAFHLHLPSVLSPYLGESERALTSLFSRARAASPSLLVIDDLPSLLPPPSTSSESSSSSEPSNRLYTTLLTLLDGVEGRKGQVMVVATAGEEGVGEALEREGRLGVKLSMRRLEEGERREVVRVVGRREGVEWGDDVDWGEVGKVTKGAVGASLAELVRCSVWAAWREEGERGERVYMRHVRAAMKEMGWEGERAKAEPAVSMDELTAANRAWVDGGMRFA